jgi:LPS-assembly protein
MSELAIAVQIALFYFKRLIIVLSMCSAPLRSVSTPFFRVHPWHWFFLTLFSSGILHAQDIVSDPGLQLQASPQLQETLSPEQRKESPLFFRGDRIRGRPDLETVIEGHAELRKSDFTILADTLEYYQPTDQARASGNVRINRSGNVYEGSLLELKVEAFEGVFLQPRYQFLQNNVHGQADSAHFLNEHQTVVHNATYTSCRRQPGPDWMPDWVLRAASINLDSAEDIGTAQNAVLHFKNVPIIATPSISFPLSGKRKSGVLPITAGIDNINGTEVSVPYYWNIAPNRDATITTTMMTQRGVDMGAQFRYLEPGYSGTLQTNFMPSDALRSMDRSGVSWQHQGTVATGLPGMHAILLNMNLNRVSDDNYWRDFTRSGAALTQRLLPNDVLAQWGQDGVRMQARHLRWQTLQDATAPIVPPYDRVPQLTLAHSQYFPSGWDWNAEIDLTQFEADRQRTNQPNALRSYAQLQLSRPWIGAAGFIIPRVQLHATQYQFDAPLRNSAQAADSVIPTFSLDSGLVFERETTFRGNALLQTLEPRLFYVYTPFHDQSLLPNYDTGVNDFSFATIFTENAFVGHDKIADNDLLTLGLTSRILDAQSGAQWAKFGVAQRLRREVQRVTLLPGQAPAEAGLSDILLGASVAINDRWALDSTTQYNPKTEQSVRSVIGARYSPGNYRVFNAAYRFQRDLSEQIDLSGQWPLNDLWGDRGNNLVAGQGLGEGRYYLVGRLNYSINENRLVDTLVGVEYDAGCWISRLVLERIQTSAATATERLMFQLEFLGFGRLGISPQKTLTQSISRYQNLRDSFTKHSRFSNYE